MSDAALMVGGLARSYLERVAMLIASQRSRLWRGVVVSVIGLAGVLAVGLDAQGVILYTNPDDNSDPSRNTSPPSAADGLAGWNIEAQWSSFLATPIDATHFIAAKHVGFASSTITFQNVAYQVDPSSRVSDPSSDLTIYTLQSGSFPTWATLYSSAVDGSEIGKTLTVIGRGTQRGASVYVGGSVAGWQWGASDGVQSWGQNVVSGLYDYNSYSPNSLLYFNFDPNAIANPAALCGGDSSGGVFIYSNGQWKLAGINYAVDSPWSLTGAANDSGFIADIFNAQGLYYKDSSGNWVLDPNPDTGASYASDISNELPWIESMVPDVAVPEPGALVLLASGVTFLLLVGRFVRRRSRSA